MSTNAYYFSHDSNAKDDPKCMLYIGSGTTAIAAIKEGRNYIGSEISPKYTKLANERISIELSQIKLF